MNVDGSFLLEAFPLVSCPNLTSLLCSFHPTTDYSAPPWFRLPCVYWLRCSPFARFGKSEGFGVYGSLVRFDSVRLWASLLLSLLPLYGSDASLKIWRLTEGFQEHSGLHLCERRKFGPKRGRETEASPGLKMPESLKRTLRRSETRFSGLDPSVDFVLLMFGGNQALLVLWGCFLAARTGRLETHPRAIRTLDCAKGSRIRFLYYYFRGHNKRKCGGKKQSENFHRLYFMFRVTQQFWWHRGTLRSPQRWHTFCKQVQDASYMIN